MLNFDDDEDELEEEDAEVDDGEEEEEEDADDDDDRMEVSPAHSNAQGVMAPLKSSPALPLYVASYRELGDEATWTLSSAKPGNGAEALRNGEMQTYWQSDGTHPHTVTVQFHRRVALAEIAMYCDVRLDESYTPKKVRVLSGTTLRDLEVVCEVELDNPEGWVMIGVKDPVTGRPLRSFTVQIQCTLMHQNGRDTHVRAIRLFGPRSTVSDEAPVTLRKSAAGPHRSSAAPRSQHITSGPALSSFANIR